MSPRGILFQTESRSEVSNYSLWLKFIRQQRKFLHDKRFKIGFNIKKALCVWIFQGLDQIF